MRNRIAAVIVTFNRHKELERTIDHLLGQDPEITLVVVDNHSEDGTEELILSMGNSRVVHLRQETNIGSAGGFSVGMNYCLGKFQWIWLFNDDSRPKTGSLDSLLNAIARLNDSSLGMIKIGMLHNGRSESSNWNGRRITKLIERSEVPVKTDLITFDGCLISTAMIGVIGTCDPQFFMGIYEFDFCLRASDRGFNIYTLPNGLIEDEKLGSVKGIPYWRMYYITRNHLYLGIKRKSFKTIVQFLNLETKKTIAILFLQRDKYRKLKYKMLAVWHAITKQMGKRVEPTKV